MEYFFGKKEEPEPSTKSSKESKKSAKKTESKDSKGKPQPPIDTITRIMGSLKKYQYWMCFLIFLTKFPIIFHQMSILFLAPPASYTCPNTGAQTCPCSNPTFDKSLFKNTIIMEWKLICKDKWKKDFTQTVLHCGTLLGSVLCGMASDRFGRRYPLIAVVILQILSGIGAAYMKDYWAFNFFRVVIGFTVGGSMVVGFVLLMEYVGSQYRDVISAAYQVPFNIGHSLLAVFGYYFRDYSTYQLAISLPTIALLIYICLLPESPRWLLAMNKTEKAVKIMEKVAKINGLPVENIKKDAELYQQQRAASAQKKCTIADLFKTPNIRRNNICMAANWLICSYCFYGVSQYVGQLGGNIFINVAASGALALAGTLVSIPLMKLMTRRWVIISSNIICSACLFGIAVLPDYMSVILACIGCMTSFIVFCVIYLYTSELFPTVIRNNAMGVSSMAARIGAMIAPFMVGLNEYGKWCAPVAFGVAPLIAAVFCYFLPETKGCQLMATIEEGENFGTKK